MADINELHRKVWQKTVDGKITEEQLKEVIHENRGMDPRTVKKWRENLRDKAEIISSVDGGYEVEEPPEPDTDFSGSRDEISTNIKIPRQLKNKADEMGINISQVCERALAEKISSIEDYAERFADTEDEKLIEYFWALIEEGLHEKRGPKPKQETRDERRKELFKDIYEIGGKPANVDRFRTRAYKMAQRLGIE